MFYSDQIWLKNWLPYVRVYKESLLGSNFGFIIEEYRKLDKDRKLNKD